MAEEQAVVETKSEAPSFDNSFEKFLKEEIGDAKPAEVPAATEVPAETKAEEAPADGAPPAAAAAEADPSAPAPEAGTPGEKAAGADDHPAAKPDDKPAVKEDDDAILQRLASLVKKAPDTPKVDTPPAPAPAPVEEPPLLSKDEQTLLAKFEEDWPDVHKAQQIQRRVEYKQIVGYVFNEIAKELKPIQDMVRELATRTAYSDIKTKVEDYDDVRDGVVEWVNSQPAYLQTAYKHVIDAGTPDEVVDLIQRFKAATGVQPKAAAPATPLKKEPELPAATKQAAASLAPVGSKRSATASTALDPSDFGKAFEMFAEKVL